MVGFITVYALSPLYLLSKFMTLIRYARTEVKVVCKPLKTLIISSRRRRRNKSLFKTHCNKLWECGGEDELMKTALRRDLKGHVKRAFSSIPVIRPTYPNQANKYTENLASGLHTEVK